MEIDHRSNRETFDISDESPIDTDPYAFRTMLQWVSEVEAGVRFCFVAESSAAGLAGLRRTGDEDRGFLLKLLVVDVGAGSTDVGCVIRSVPNPQWTPQNRPVVDTSKAAS